MDGRISRRLLKCLYMHVLKGVICNDKIPFPFQLCTFPVLQQFGLLFRDKLAILEISSSQITTIININAALTSIIGLANGPVFRRFTFRQVSFCGALIVSIALFFTSIANSFIAFVITFSVMYGKSVRNVGGL